MARTVVPLRGADIRNRREAEAAGSKTAPVEPGDRFPDKLVKYVPAETLAFFTPLSAAIGAERPYLLIAVTVVGMVGTVGYLWRTARKLPKVNKPRIYFYILSVVAFACWAVGTNSNIDKLIGIDAFAAGIVLTSAVFLIPLIDEVLSAWLGSDDIAA